VNGFAGADESQDLFVNRKHGERSLRTRKHGVREERRSRTTTLNQMRETRGGIHSHMSRLHARRASYKIMRSSVCHQCDTPGDKRSYLRVLTRHKLLKDGWCWWYRKYAPGDAVLEGLENEAREGRKGLWADPSPIIP
jgi:hypothetical protein